MLEIEDYRPESGGKATIATFTVHVANAKMRIRKCKLLKLKNGHFKIALPSYSEVPFADRNPHDPVSFKPYIEFSADKGKEFENRTLEALSLRGLISTDPPTPHPF